MRHNIVPSPPLVCTAESEAGPVQSCAAQHVWRKITVNLLKYSDTDEALALTLYSTTYQRQILYFLFI